MLFFKGYVVKVRTLSKIQFILINISENHFDNMLFDNEILSCGRLNMILVTIENKQFKRFNIFKRIIGYYCMIRKGENVNICRAFYCQSTRTIH